MLDVFVTSRVRRKILVVFAKYPDFKTHTGFGQINQRGPGQYSARIKAFGEGEVFDYD